MENEMRRFVWMFCGFSLICSPLARAGTISLDFEAFTDSTILTNQYSGFLFTNTDVWSAGLSLNEADFPPRSGTNVAADVGGQISIAFSAPVLTFSGFFTYSSALTLNAFDSLNQGVGTANSAFSSNFTSSGNPPNEFLQVSFAGGISHVIITGNPSDGSFVLDDVTVTTPSNAVPEPSSQVLIISGLLLCCGHAVRTARARTQ
jgi:hypothetical protein